MGIEPTTFCVLSRRDNPYTTPACDYDDCVSYINGNVGLLYPQTAVKS